MDSGSAVRAENGKEDYHEANAKYRPFDETGETRPGLHVLADVHRTAIVMRIAVCGHFRPQIEPAGL
jgi:hypothetical protein